MASVRASGVKHFVLDQIADFEESPELEFKGHYSLQEPELPLWLYKKNTDKRSKKPISQTLNAFLNTGKGGTVLMGILDCGKVRGFPLTRYKKDHFIGNLEDLMGRYNPPVEKKRYRLNFIPVVAPGSSQAQIDRAVNYQEAVDEKLKQKNHLLRTNKYCWCDNDLISRTNCTDVVIPSYVIRVTIKPWNANYENALGRMAAHPVHMDECGNSYFRQQASVTKFTRREIIEMTREEVSDYYQGKVAEMEAIKQEITEKLIHAQRSQLLK